MCEVRRTRPSCQTYLTFERFTDSARRALVLAQEEARLLNHSFIGTEHILLGLIDEDDGVAAQALEQLDVSLQKVREKVIEAVGLPETTPTGSAPFTPRAKKVLDLSLREARKLGHDHIGTEHLLLGLLREGDGVAAGVLVSLGVDITQAREQVIRMLSGYHGSTVKQRETSGTTRRWLPIRDPGRTTSVEHIGKEWTARVVRAGRKPSDYEAAYADLGELVAVRGLELDDVEPGLLVVASVDTDEGAGIALSISYEVEPEVAEDEEPHGDETS